jgi:hypothetical protein
MAVARKCSVAKKLQIVIEKMGRFLPSDDHQRRFSYGLHLESSSGLYYWPSPVKTYMMKRMAETPVKNQDSKS